MALTDRRHGCDVRRLRSSSSAVDVGVGEVDRAAVWVPALAPRPPPPAGEDRQRCWCRAPRCASGPPPTSRCRPRPAGSPRRRRSGCRAWSAPTAACWPHAAQREADGSRAAHRATCARAGRRRPPAAAPAGARRTMRPSRSRTTRLAWAATSSSWVISTIVRPDALSSVEQRQHLGGGGAVEVAGRLVGQEQRRLGDQRPGHRDPLLLAAGELVGLVVGPVGEADRRRARPAPGRAARAASTPA